MAVRKKYIRLLVYLFSWLVIIKALNSSCRGEETSGQSKENDGIKKSLSISADERNSSDYEGNEDPKLQENEDIWSMVASMGVTGDNKRRNGNTSNKNYDWHMMLDDHNQFRLDWTVRYQENEIIFALTINETQSGFQHGSDVFALGFSEDGRLASSDFCIIWYDLSYTIHLQDARTNSENLLELLDGSVSFCKLIKSQLNRISRFTSSSNDEVDEQQLLRDANDHYYRDHHKSIINSNNERNTTGNAEQHKFRGRAPLSGRKLVEIIFKRPLDVCSDSSYYKIDNGTTHLVWFTLKGPLLSIDQLNLSELSNPVGSEQHLHTSLKDEHKLSSSNSYLKWGMKRVQLIATKVPSGKGEFVSKNHFHEIRMSNFSIPDRETTYWCKLFKLPRKFQLRRHHITRYEAIIEQGNEDVVHHMELFNCANLNREQEMALDELYHQAGSWEGNCNGLDRPQASDPCRRVILAWAMGAHPLEYPEQVGQSIGGRSYSPYVVLEVHYNNMRATAESNKRKQVPVPSSGRLDNSGLRFEYTNKLRSFDAGILEVGLEYSDKNSIPPGMITPIAGHCVSECTRIGLGVQSGVEDASWLKHQATSRRADREGIFVFAAQMHTHLAGIASWTEHVREGRILAELQRDNHYSPHFQEIRLLPEPVYVAPGDALIHYCLYDTTNRTKITLGGFATTDEMCVTYLHYYPRSQLEVCKSSIDTRTLESYFAQLALNESQKTSLKLTGSDSIQSRASDEQLARRMSVSENYEAIEWSRRRSYELIELYANSPLSVQCNRSDGDRFPGFWNAVPPTRVWDRDTKPEAPHEWRSWNGRELVGYRGSKNLHEQKAHAQCRGVGKLEREM